MKGASQLRALYLHVPFCLKKCGYCGFYSIPASHHDPHVRRYIELLEALVARLGSHDLLQGVETAYIGGGTPTMAGDALPSLVRAVRAACPSLREFSVEANPESLDEYLAFSLGEAGVTRVSLGVQSLSDRELQALGRVHSSDETVRAARHVVAAGLDLSCDLMCGIPHQTSTSWQETLELAIGFNAAHISCYPLAIEEGTPFDESVLAHAMEVPDADLQGDMMEMAADMLGSAGFHRYEVASYARLGKECLHNKAYWSGVAYLGLGPGAASMFGASLAPQLWELFDAKSWGPLDASARVRVQMREDAESFMASLAGSTSIPAECEVLSAREAASEDLMLSMRMVEGISDDQVVDLVERGIPGDVLNEALLKAHGRGLVERDEQRGRWRPSHRGWLLGNELFGIMWDTACS